MITNRNFFGGKIKKHIDKGKVRIYNDYTFYRIGSSGSADESMSTSTIGWSVESKGGGGKYRIRKCHISHGQLFSNNGRVNI